MSSKPAGWARVDGATVRERILAVLQEHGPMTSLEVSKLIDDKAELVRHTLSQMHKKGKRFPQQVYIAGWTRECVEGARFYLRPQYDLGRKKDAEKPVRLTNAEKNQRLRDRKRVLVNSVFQLAERQGRNIRKALPDILKS